MKDAELDTGANKLDELKELISTQSVAIYDYTLGELPDVLADKEKGLIYFFQHGGKKNASLAPETKTILRSQQYSSMAEIARWGAEVTFLDGRTVRNILAKYPSHSRYVLLRIAPGFDWLLALVGLRRRLRKTRVSNLGTIEFAAKDSVKPQKWLVLRNDNLNSQNAIYLSLSEEVGTKGLFEFLNENNISYVVPRFFEKLPELNRKGGDLDLLVADEHGQVVREFLRKNPGRIPVDLHTVSGQHPGSNFMPYFPPVCARQMLLNAIDGPAGCRIPSPRDHFHGMVYHAVYHKGFFGGIPTTLSVAGRNKKPENDYAGIIASLSKKQGLELEINLEALDEYLETVGWRPQLDTLSAMTECNEWIWYRFFASRRFEELGIGVMMLKQKAVDRDMREAVIAAMRDSGFEVLREAVFTAEQKELVKAKLRGGNWAAKAGNPTNFVPAASLCIFDTKLAGAAMAKPGERETRLRPLKLRLRKTFDDEPESMFHATDDTEQSWEYIDVIWPDEREKIESEVKQFFAERDGPVARFLRHIHILTRNSAHVMKERTRLLLLRLFFN